jgi:hypothetical protein
MEYYGELGLWSHLGCGYQLENLSTPLYCFEDKQVFWYSWNIRDQEESGDR